MDAIETIYGRRAVRDFTADTPSTAEVTALLEAAVQAPSGVNRQPWAFVVVTGRPALASLSAKAKAHLLKTMAAESSLARFRETLGSDAFDLFYNAPMLIVICATDPDLMSLKDCCLAAENLMLAAHAKGLGSCWIGFAEAYLTSPEGKAALAVPDGFIPVAPIIVGRPAATPVRPERKAPDVRWLGAPAA
jgi:nitroreductase